MNFCLPLRDQHLFACSRDADNVQGVTAVMGMERKSVQLSRK